MEANDTKDIGLMVVTPHRSCEVAHSFLRHKQSHRTKYKEEVTNGKV